MDYITAKKAAENWGISVRSVQQYCIRGKIPGVSKIGNNWMIPAESEKPGKYARTDPAGENLPEPETPDEEPAPDALNLALDNLCAGAIMPLLNTPFAPGEALVSAENIADPDLRAVAIGEYYYFSGNSAKAAGSVEKYLESDNIGLRLSACWIYAYASLALDRIDDARLAMKNIRKMIASIDADTPKDVRTLILFVATGASVLLHLPLTYELPPMNEIVSLLPPGLRQFALYVYAHYAYLNKAYGASVGIAETALALEPEIYPIPTIYIHLIAVMDYMCLKQPEEARVHMLKAWEIAEKDGLIEAFGEHHGLVGGMLEATLKKTHPEEFKKIIAITYKFSAGWRKVHNPETGNNVADNLSTTEFSVSMLTSKGYTTKEIAALLKISENTVKYHINQALGELGISDRRELKKFMLE